MYHVEKILRLNKVAVFICNIVLLAVLILLAGPIENIVSAVKVYEMSSYKYLGNISENSNYSENSYYANIGYISFYTEDGVYLNCENLMTMEGVCYGGNYLTRYHGQEIEKADLSNGECAISANLSLFYNLHKGDHIKVRINFQNYNIVVKYIFEPYYGLKEADVFNHMGLLVLGYNEDMIGDAVTYDMVHFAEKSDFFVDSNLSVKEEVLSGLRQTFSLLCVLIAGVALLTCFGLEYFCSDDIRNDVFVLRYIGLSRIRVFKYTLLDAFYKYFSVYALPMLILAIYFCLKNYHYLHEFVMVLLCFCGTILYSVAKNQLK